MVAVLAQCTANSELASISVLNPYAIFPAGTGGGGGGSCAEFDMVHSNGTDDSATSSTTNKTGLLIVSQGANQPWEGLGITNSGKPWVNGISIYPSSVSKYSFVIDSYAPTMYIDSIGNTAVQSLTLGYGGAAASLGAVLSLGRNAAGTSDIVLSTDSANTNLFPYGVPVGALHIGNAATNAFFGNNITTYGNANFQGNFVNNSSFSNTGVSIGWNYSGGGGEVDFMCGSQAASGGVAFWQVAATGKVTAKNPTVSWNGSGLLSAFGGFADGSALETTIANAATYQISNNVTTLQCTNAGTIASATIKLPAAPTQGQILWLCSVSQITSVTWTTPAGVGIQGAPATISGNGAVTLQYINGTWYHRVFC